MYKFDTNENFGSGTSTLSLTQKNHFILTVNFVTPREFKKIFREVEQCLEVQLAPKLLSKGKNWSRYSIKLSSKNIASDMCGRVIELLARKSRNLNGSLSFETISK